MGFLVEITDSEFEKMRKLIYDQFGIRLTEQKRTLLVSRLQKVFRTRGISSFSEYYDYVVSDASRQALTELVNYISTNHTFFYREHDHFDHFQKHSFPELIRRLKQENSRDIRIWSAGCSSGEEPYMLVILMMEVLGSDYKNWDAGILATDISMKVLEIARKGIYEKERLDLLPDNYKKKYFNKLDAQRYEVKPEVKREVTFGRFNLMNDTYPFSKEFHMTFCRNVMIYFDEPTKERVVNRFCDTLEVGGYFYIGHSETIRRFERFEYLQPALYRRKY